MSEEEDEKAKILTIVILGLLDGPAQPMDIFEVVEQHIKTALIEERIHGIQWIASEMEEKFPGQIYPGAITRVGALRAWIGIEIDRLKRIP